MAIPVKEEVKGIFRLGPLKTGRPTASTSPFLVVGTDRAMVLEPGEDGQVAALVEGIKQCGVDLDRVEYIWASHIHLHHIQGLPWLLKELPKAKFLVHPRGAQHVVQPERLLESTLQVWGDKCYGPFAGIPRERVMPVEDNQIIDLGGHELQIIFSPGHAPHHMGLFDKPSRALFPGDLDTGAGASGAGATTFLADVHIASMQRYLDLNPSMLLTFGRTDPLPAEEVLKGVQVEFLGLEVMYLKCLKEKMSVDEMAKRTREFRDWIGQERWTPVGPGLQSSARGERAQGEGVAPHVLAYLKRKYPELDIPTIGGRRSSQER